MRTILTILGGIFLVGISLVGGFIGYVAFVGGGLDTSSKAYVDESVPAIISSWSREEFLKRASPQLRAVATDEQVGELFLKFHRLGAFQSYDGAKGQANINLTQHGREVTAAYKANATFQNGKAEIDVRLIQIDGAWRILRFYVNSPAFMR